MKKKYILVLTFLLVLCGQVSFGQRSGGGEDYQPMFGGDLVSQMNEYDRYGTNELYPVSVWSSGSYGNMSMSDAVDYYNWMHPDYNGTPDKEDDPATDDFCTVYPDLCEYVNPKTCTLTCEGNFTLDPDNCACVCNLPPKIGYIIDGANCVYLSCEKIINASITDHVYNTINGIQEAGKTELNDYGNVHLVSPAGLPSEFNSPDFKWSDPDTGFSSALYSVDHGNGNIELVYATQGTNPLDLQDWVNNGQQALGYVSAQYYQSVANANVLATWAANNGYTLSFTGHSLGGGLANANALATGLPATIYNPAGLSDATVNDPNLNLNLNYSSKVTAFIVQGEPVDYLNTKLETPVRGTRNYIGLPQDTNSLYGTLSNLTIAGLISTVQLHLMSSVISNLDCND